MAFFAFCVTGRCKRSSLQPTAAPSLRGTYTILPRVLAFAAAPPRIPAALHIIEVFGSVAARP